MVALDPGTRSPSAVAQLRQIPESRAGRDAGAINSIWSKIFQPMSVAVMMLMALSFIFGPLRSVPMGVRVVTDQLALYSTSSIRSLAR